jgi:hypothetical protein
MSRNKVVRSVSFNITNNDDKRYLERIESIGNFSGYVKRLIEKDIRQRKVIKSDNKVPQPILSDGPIIIRTTETTLKTV